MTTGRDSQIARLVAFCVAAVAGAAFPAFAGTAIVEGSDLVVSADAGETYTINSAVGNYARLVKRGDGEVKLTAATSAFAGTVLIEKGTLSITDLGALGESSPVTVASGSTFCLRTPNSTGVFNTHKLTISGDGVDGKGAIRYLPPNGGRLDDSLLGAIELADDATIECDYRWGVNGAVTLNGHTLRRISSDASSGQWMLNGATVSGPGTVKVENGQIVFQGNVDSSANVAYVVTNSSIVSLWETKRSIPSSFEFFAGTRIVAGSGTNHISGPVQLSNHADATKDGYVTFEVSAPRVLCLDGPVAGDERMAYNTANNGSLFLNGDVSVRKWVYVNSGTHVAMTSTASRVYQSGFGVNGGGSAWIGGGNTLFSRVVAGSDDNKQGAFRQTGGVIGVMRDSTAGGNATSVGHWAMSGGEAYMSNDVHVAKSAGSFGSFVQSGGLFKLDGGNLYAGNAGSAVFHVCGGTNDTRVSQGGQSVRFHVGEGGGFSDVTVSGEGTLLATETLRFGGEGVVSTNVFNVKDGATVKATRLFKHEKAAAGCFVNVSADGGTLMPTFGYDWTDSSPDAADYSKRRPDHFVIWKKGLVIDTSESTGNNPSSTVQFLFESPSGNGVESVSLPTEGEYASRVYCGPARVVFVDATGWGASAYAEYDFNTKKHTKIVVTSRGCNYSSNTKAYVESPDRTTRYECSLTLSDNAGMGGELVKRGAHALYLHATNTITGGVAVESGTLHAETVGVVPPNTPVRVEHGARLKFANSAPVSLSTFTGAGNVTGCDVTVVNAVRASCEDLFAGKYATFAGKLTFAQGATFTITDPENLASYVRSGAVAAFTAQQVIGTPTLAFEGKPTGSVRWTLRKKNSTTYKFAASIGTVVVVR